MSVSTLKAKREAIEKAGIGIHLAVVKDLFSAIDQHVSEDNTSAANDAAQKATALFLQERVNQLEAEVTKLQKAAVTATETVKVAVA